MFAVLISGKVVVSLIQRDKKEYVEGVLCNDNELKPYADAL